MQLLNECTKLKQYEAEKDTFPNVSFRRLDSQSRSILQLLNKSAKLGQYETKKAPFQMRCNPLQ